MVMVFGANRFSQSLKNLLTVKMCPFKVKEIPAPCDRPGVETVQIALDGFTALTGTNYNQVLIRTQVPE